MLKVYMRDPELFGELALTTQKLLYRMTDKPTQVKSTWIDNNYNNDKYNNNQDIIKNIGRFHILTIGEADEIYEWQARGFN